MKNFFRSTLLLLLVTTMLYAQESKDKVKFSGLMFGDFFYNIDNVAAAKKDQNGFQFRRIYVTTDYTVDENFDARFRLEADQTGGSLTSGGKLGVMVKDAYLRWKGIFDGSDMFFGISPTPAFDVSEGVYGYRSLEKTTMDLFGIVPSRDFGVDLKGKLAGDGSINYWLKIGNNSGNSPEVDKYKRYYAMLQFKPAGGFIATVYGDYASKSMKLDPTDNMYKANNQFVGSVFLGYKPADDFAVGFEGFFRAAQNDFQASAGKTLQNRNGIGLSFWGWTKLSDKTKLVARFDNYDPNTDGSNDATTFFMAGLDYKVAGHVSIIPNFELFKYQGKDSSDLTGRVTFSYTF